MPEFSTAEEYSEKVIKINRVAKWSVMAADSVSAHLLPREYEWKIGVGFGKANEVSIAIQKAINAAKESLRYRLYQVL